MQVQTTDRMQQTTCKIPVRSCAMNVRPTTGMNEYNMPMCSIQLTTCKCAAYNLPDSVVLLRCSTALSSHRRAGCFSTAVSYSRSALLCRGGPPARTHCSPNKAWQPQRTALARSAICGRRRAWRCGAVRCGAVRCGAVRCMVTVAATIMARVSAWIAPSLAAGQYSQCHSAPPPLAPLAPLPADGRSR